MKKLSTQIYTALIIMPLLGFVTMPQTIVSDNSLLNTFDSNVDQNSSNLFLNSDTLCNNSAPIDLNELLDNPDNLTGDWATDGTLIGTSMFDPNMLPSGLYSISYTLNPMVPDCPNVFTNTILVRNQPIAVPIEGPYPCSEDFGGGPTTTNLYDWLEPGHSSGYWVQIGGIVLSFTDDGLNTAIVDFIGQEPDSEFTFQFITNDAQEPCSDVVAEIIITVLSCDCPLIFIQWPGPLCNNNALDLCSLVSGSGPGIFSVTSEGGADLSILIDASGCLIDFSGVITGTYEICYTLDEVLIPDCPQTECVTIQILGFNTTTITDPPEVCSDPNGTGLTTLDFTSYVGNAGIGTWTDLDGTGVDIATITDQSSVSFEGIPEGAYQFSYTIDNPDPCEDVLLIMTVIVTCTITSTVEILKEKSILEFNALEIGQSVNLNLEEGSSWEIYSTDGQKVLSGEASSIVIDLTTGHYIIRSRKQSQLFRVL